MKPAIKVIGVPNDINSSFMRGSSAAPPLIREALYSASSNLFSESGLNLDQKGIWEDLGDIEFAGQVAVENFKKIFGSLFDIATAGINLAINAVLGIFGFETDEPFKLSEFILSPSSHIQYIDLGSNILNASGVVLIAPLNC